MSITASKSPSIRRRASLLARLLPCRAGLLAALTLVLVRLVPSTVAYPPAPSHVIYGLVRDEFGVPLSVANAQILFEGTNGVKVAGNIVPELEPGVNYRLALSMDSAAAPDLYKSTALKPYVAFRIQVKVGSMTYLPI